MVVDGEKKYLFPFENNRDIAVKLQFMNMNRVFLQRKASEILSELPESDSHFKISRDLIERLKAFESLDEDKVPESSLLREFL